TYAGAKDRPATGAAASKPATRELPQQRPAGPIDRGRDAAGRAQPSPSRPDLARERPSTPSVAQTRPDVTRDRPSSAPAARPSARRAAPPQPRPHDIPDTHNQ